MIITNVKELDEQEIADMIYERINANWGKFPNIWNYVTKDDMATQVAMDLYRPRKDNGIPHIIYYYNNRGERSLKNLINTIAYNVLVAEARDIYSTGVFSNDARRNVYSPLSLDMPIKGAREKGHDKDITLGDSIEDKSVDLSEQIDYKMLVESIPNVEVEDVFYFDKEKYIPLTYKILLRDLINGYKLTQINDKLFKKNKYGEYKSFRDLSLVCKNMKRYIRKFLANEYNYDVRNYMKGERII